MKTLLTSIAIAITLAASSQTFKIEMGLGVNQYLQGVGMINGLYLSESGFAARASQQLLFTSNTKRDFAQAVTWAAMAGIGNESYNATIGAGYTFRSAENKQFNFFSANVMATKSIGEHLDIGITASIPFGQKQSYNNYQFLLIIK